MTKSKEEKLLSEISKKLSTIIKLSAASIAANKELENPRKTLLLSRAGFNSKEIGDLLGIRADSVRHLRSKAKKR